MKVIYRILFLLTLFVGAVLFFGSNMQERTFFADVKTIEMSDSTLPLVELYTDGEHINLLHGYCSNLDKMLVRESLTPVDTGREFELYIDENSYNIKKLNYEIFETACGEKKEEGSVVTLEKIQTENKEFRHAKITLKNELLTGEEYVVKFTLISNESKRIYYYTRIKLLKESYLSEKIAFVRMFHNALLNKERAADIKRYLETDKGADETDYSRATLKNSLDFISYGSLAPEVIYTEIPTVTECTTDTASVVLTSWMKIQTPTGEEEYKVKEYFRFQYTKNRVYLYNYERSMESVFDVNSVSLAKSEFKFGITAQKEENALVNTDRTKVAFVRDGSLYSYSAADHTLTTVYSFCKEDSDYRRDRYDKHDIKLLSIDDEGAVDFLVYGYMNRGEYEGRVCMLMYTYYPWEQMIEERAYFPMGVTYDILKETLGDFAYCNRQDILYFHMYDTIYTYNLVTKKLDVVAEGVSRDRLMYEQEGKMLAWQQMRDGRLSDCISVLNLETGVKSSIQSTGDRILGLLGQIETNLIVGVSETDTTLIREDGIRLYAYEKAEILDYAGNRKKTYQVEPYYITGATVTDNVLELHRAIVNPDTNRYEAVKSDFILNYKDQTLPPAHISERVTEQMRKEYYLSLPEKITFDGIPVGVRTKNMVISEDVTVRINTPDAFEENYLVYAYGEVRGLTRDAGAAIAYADLLTGSVIDENGSVCFSRGVKSSSKELAKPEVIRRSEGRKQTLAACLQMFLEYRNIEADITQYDPNTETAEKWLEKYLKSDVLYLSGITCSEAMYYVYYGNPVIAVNENQEAIFIYAYDSSGVTAIVPLTGKNRRFSEKEMTQFLGDDYYFMTVR